MKKICPSCGWGNANTREKCSRCGTQLLEVVASAESGVQFQSRMHQTNAAPVIQARSQPCYAQLDRKRKEAGKAVGGIMWLGIGLTFLIAGGTEYIAAIIEDTPLKDVEGPSLLQCLLGLVVLIGSCILSKKLHDKVVSPIDAYCSYCSVESLIVDDQKIYGSNTKGHVQFSYNNISGVRCRPSDMGINDILEIQVVDGRIHTFYSFSNSRELQTVIQMNLQNGR